jgi:hypothetical protein
MNIVIQSNKIVTTIDNSTDRKVNLVDFIREVYPLESDASNNTRGRHERRVEAIVSRVVRESRQLGQPIEDFRQVSAWMAYNGLQGYVQHDARRNNNPSNNHRMSMALEDKAVARAAQLAFA